MLDPVQHTAKKVTDTPPYVLASQVSYWLPVEATAHSMTTIKGSWGDRKLGRVAWRDRSPFYAFDSPSISTPSLSPAGSLPTHPDFIPHPLRLKHNPELMCGVVITSDGPRG